MSNNFTITIHDDNNFKQINLHKFVKKLSIYAATFLIGFILITTMTVIYLNYQLNLLQIKKNNMQKAYEKLDKHNLRLKWLITKKQNTINKKKQELGLISDKLNNIQTLIGLNLNPSLPLNKRADLTNATSQQIALLMRFVPNGSPVVYRGITSKFGFRINPILHVKEFHEGDDLRASVNTPIHATANGVIEYAAYNKKSGYGRLIIMDNGYGFQTYFGHLHKIVVKSGEFIKKGQIIGYTGDTGLSNGPHLHYEIRFVQRALNPFWFIKWNVRNYKEIFKKERHVSWQSLLTMMSSLKIIVPTRPLSLSALQLKVK